MNKVKEMEVGPEMNKKPEYKKTKLGWIPEEWQLIKLSDVFEFKNGVNAPQEDYGTGVKFINVSEVLNHSYITTSIIPGSVKINDKKLRTYSVQWGDVLFNRTSEVPEDIARASVYLDNQEVVFGGFVIRGRPINNVIDDNFKKFCFENFAVRKQIVAKGQGAVRTNIGQNDLGQIKLLLPSINEQKKIANILSTWDRAIQLTQRLIEAKEQQKKGLMQRLLTGKVRMKGYSGKWKEKQLDSILKEVEKQPVINPSNYELLSVRLYCKGIVATGKHPNPTPNGRPYYFRKPGELIIGRQNFHNGGFGIMPKFGRKLVASNAISSYLTKTNVNLLWLYYYFSNVDFYRKIGHLIGGTGQKEISKKDFRRIKILQPTKSEQDSIATVISKADEELSILRNKLSALEKEKKGLMQRLLTGRIQVKNYS